MAVFCGEEGGRGERIRTSGPCLPKVQPSWEIREKIWFLPFGAGIVRIESLGLLAAVTGALPEVRYHG